MKLGEFIKQYRVEHGLSQRQFAIQCNMSNGYISMLEEGKRPKSDEPVVPTISTMKKIAAAMGMGLHELIGLVDDMPISISEKSHQDLFAQLGIMPISKKKLPILGNAACGEPKYAEQTFEGYVTVGADMQADFCLYAKGDSMVNARIHDGDIVFVRKQDIVEDGEIAVVLVEDDTTIKRVYYDRENNVLTLVPENPAFKIMRYMGAELNQIRILGKVIAGQYNVG